MSKLIEEVRTALAEATPGPWDKEVERWNNPCGQDTARGVGPNHPAIYLKGNPITPEKAIADAHLIANAPTWLEELSDRVEALEADVLRLQMIEDVYSRRKTRTPSRRS